ncbi:MAG: bifunctional phosphoribosylaminoimidazolecarboxamide formyltransferase/IMP cyclohydrolase [Candidatus Eisenbacteria bacterium]|nr:bifunctional phosphoribosylaminoimidazolecarboxamide formyltransferase/IMP cyclohydrolase [Candidatus Eisenbacteria bacterium]
MSIARALVSVSDKAGIVEFVLELDRMGVEVVSTGGTARVLRAAGISCREVSDLTGAPEILDGRVKTLHPRIHGAILSLPQKEAHVATLEREKIEAIDMVVVNLYPFEKVVAEEGATLADALDEIDIGGVTLLRAAAKNFANVVIVSSPDQYGWVLDLLKQNDLDLPEEARRRLAVKAFDVTRHYDRAIHRYLSGVSDPDETFPTFLSLDYERVSELRYGENPHQRGAVYHTCSVGREPCVVNAEKLSGKELSYNNLTDLDAALALVREFPEPAAAVIKHGTPCGVASATTIARSYERALACDPVSAFGSVIALNRTVDMEVAKLIHETHFVEAVVAPDYFRNALELMSKKKNRRLLKARFPDLTQYGLRAQRQLRSLLCGGLLVQDLDTEDVRTGDLKVVTDRAPSDREMESLRFAWRVVKHVRSNAIVLAKGRETVGVGAGQMSRVDASVLAVWKAGERVKGSVMASDAFFPMRDAVDAAAEAGVTAIIQPGGSKGDDEAIAAANEHSVAMVFTGMRHFKH